MSIFFQKKLLILQLLFTFCILALPITAGIKIGAFFCLWIITFQRITKQEAIIFIISNCIFVASDIGAIKNGFFSFSSPALEGLPYYEFFLWGFYLLHAHRVIGGPYPKRLEWRTIILATLCSLSFVLLSSTYWVLLVSGGIFLLSLYFFHEKKDLFFAGYLIAIGVIVECIGIYSHLWVYPTDNYVLLTLQIMIMWGSSGLFFRRLMGPYLN